MPLVNAKSGVATSNCEQWKKKGYNYAKVNIVTTILNVNYTKPKFFPFLKSNTGNDSQWIYVPYNDLVKDLPYWLHSTFPHIFPSYDSLLSTTRIPEGFPNTNTPRCSPGTHIRELLIHIDAVQKGHLRSLLKYDSGCRLRNDDRDDPTKNILIHIDAVPKDTNTLRWNKSLLIYQDTKVLCWLLYLIYNNFLINYTYNI